MPVDWTKVQKGEYLKGLEGLFEGGSGGGGDPLAAEKLAALIQERDERREERKEGRQLTGMQNLGKRVETQKIPETGAAIKEVGAITKGGSDIKSYGGKSWVPTTLVELMEGRKVPFTDYTPFPEGSTQERQAVSALGTVIRHPLFGATLTPQERADFEEGFGTIKTALDPAQRRAALNRITSMYNSKIKNIRGSFPEVFDQFNKETGGTLEEIPLFGDQPVTKPEAEHTGVNTHPQKPLVKPEPQSLSIDQKQKRLQELRAKRGMK